MANAKEAQARIKINKLLETAGWRFFDDTNGKANVALEPNIKLSQMHIPVENEHLFRFKMNADSGLRVHRFRTPQSTYSDVR